MSSSPVLVLDIDGVVSLAQPGSATPWYASLQADWGFDHDEMARDFFRRDFLEVLRGRLDLYVALHGWLETKGMADRLEEFVAYWFAKDAVIDREVLAHGRRLAAAHRRPLLHRVQPGAPSHRLPARRGRARTRISTRSSIRPASASANPTACSSPTPRRAWA